MPEDARDFQYSEAQRRKGARMGMCASDDTHGGVSHHHNFALKNPLTPPPSHPSATLPLQSPKDQTLHLNSLDSSPYRPCNAQVLFDRCMTSARGANRQHSSPPNFFASTSSLATSTPRRAYLSAGEQRQQNGAGSSPEKGQAILPKW